MDEGSELVANGTGYGRLELALPEVEGNVTVFCNATNSLGSEEVFEMTRAGQSNFFPQTLLVDSCMLLLSA